MQMKPSSIIGVPFTRAVFAHSSNSFHTSKADNSQGCDPNPFQLDQPPAGGELLLFEECASVFGTSLQQIRPQAST